MKTQAQDKPKPIVTAEFGYYDTNWRKGYKANLFANRATRRNQWLTAKNAKKHRVFKGVSWQDFNADRGENIQTWRKTLK